MTSFMKGLELSRLYFLEAVQPILDTHFPALRYDAARIGSGSEVLGFDTPRSMDHHWGCSVQLFLSESDLEQFSEAINQTLRRTLPHSFRGIPTSMREIPDDPGIMQFEEATAGEVNHLVVISTVHTFLRGTLNWDSHQPLQAADWLTFPQQRLRSITAGGVWHSGLGDVQAIREQFAWYPHDVWLYLLAAGWARIAQENAFIGRCGEVGDDLGSRLIAARLVRDLMMLCFLMERVYAPYPKWFGTAFARLKCATALAPMLDRVLSADTWQGREAHFSAACELAAETHNALGITEPVPTKVSQYFGRPFHVIHGERFADAIVNAIRDPDVKCIAEKTRIGGVDQFSDSTDLREDLRPRAELKTLYRC